jgi:hypothetical protein
MKQCIWLFKPKHCLSVAAFALLTLSIPSSGLCQTMFGDPSQTSGKTGLGKIEIGGGLTSSQELREKSTTIQFRNSTQSVAIDVAATTVKIDNEYVFLSASAGLGEKVDVFGKVGLTKVDKPYKGDYGFSGGGGFRISPPQSGAIKVGVLVQAQYFSSAGDESPAMLGESGSGGSYSAYGTLHEKITMTRYDVVLGFGGNMTASVRPYAGLLFTAFNGTDEASFSGTGSVFANSTITPITSFSYKRNFQNVSSLGGIVGMTLNQSEDMGATLEIEFAPVTVSGGVSVFARF